MHMSNKGALTWKKSSRSMAGQCVEVATQDGEILVRDSKNPSGPVLAYTAGEWRAFLEGAKRGEFDNLA